MFALSQTTGYAIKAITCIAGGCEIKQIRDISQCTGVAAPYLSVKPSLFRSNITCASEIFLVERKPFLSALNSSLHEVP